MPLSRSLMNIDMLLLLTIRETMRTMSPVSGNDWSLLSTSISTNMNLVNPFNKLTSSIPVKTFPFQQINEDCMNFPLNHWNMKENLLPQTNHHSLFIKRKENHKVSLAVMRIPSPSFDKSDN